MKKLLILAFTLLQTSTVLASDRHLVFKSQVAVVSNLTLTKLNNFVEGQRVELVDQNSECKFYGFVRQIADIVTDTKGIRFYDISVNKKVCGDTVHTVSLRSSHFEWPISANYSFRLFPEPESDIPLSSKDGVD